jgi:hypothetical protein
VVVLATVRVADVEEVLLVILNGLVLVMLVEEVPVVDVKGIV